MGQKNPRKILIRSKAKNNLPVFPTQCLINLCVDFGLYFWVLDHVQEGEKED